MSRNESIITGTKAMLGAQVIRVATKGALVVLLTRFFLTPDEYGLVFFTMSVLLVATMFANLGIAKSAGRYVAQYRETDASQIPHIIRTALSANLIMILVVCIPLGVFSDGIAQALRLPPAGPLILVGVGYVAGVSLSTFARLTFQGFGRVTYSALLAGVSSTTVLVCVLGSVVLYGGAISVMWGYVAGAAIAACFGLTLLYTRFYREYERVEGEPGLARRILEYSVPLTVTRGANVLDKNVDTLLVGYFLNPAAVGFYILGKQITTFVIAPATSLGFSVAPAFGEHHARNEHEEAARLYESVFKYTLALYVPAAVGIFIVADPLITLVFGQSYAGAVPVLQIFSLFVLLQGIDKITNDSLDYLGEARARAIAKGGTSISNFLLNLVFIPAFGVVGAALATVLTHSALVGYEIVILSRTLPVSIKRLGRHLISISILAAGMGVVVTLLVPFAENLLVLLALVAVGVVTWVTLAAGAGIIDFEEIRSTIMQS